MGQLLLLLVVALTVAAVVFGVTVLITGSDSGLGPVEPDGRAVPLPAGRPLDESDLGNVRFDTALRGYRMAQVDEALRRAAYDIGYKAELVGVLEAEIEALRAGQLAKADELRQARQAAIEAAGRATPAVGIDAAPQVGPVAGATSQAADPDSGPEAAAPAAGTATAESTVAGVSSERT